MIIETRDRVTMHSLGPRWVFDSEVCWISNVINPRQFIVSKFFKWTLLDPTLIVSVTGACGVHIYMCVCLCRTCVCVCVPYMCVCLGRTCVCVSYMCEVTNLYSMRDACASSIESCVVVCIFILRIWKHRNLRAKNRDACDGRYNSTVSIIRLFGTRNPITRKSLKRSWPMNLQRKRRCLAYTHAHAQAYLHIPSPAQIFPHTHTLRQGWSRVLNVPAFLLY